MVLAFLAVIVVLAVVGGSIRAFSRHEEPGVDPSALTGLTPTWSADLGQGRVVGVAFEADRLVRQQRARADRVRHPVRLATAFRAAHRG